MITLTQRVPNLQDILDDPIERAHYRRFATPARVASYERDLATSGDDERLRARATESLRVWRILAAER